tara:strand:+ start:536 stop:838 length:303 start_codon:yes stop_codon:yes gene_type:complete
MRKAISKPNFNMKLPLKIKNLNEVEKIKEKCQDEVKHQDGLNENHSISTRNLVNEIDIIKKDLNKNLISEKIRRESVTHTATVISKYGHNLPETLKILYK